MLPHRVGYGVPAIDNPGLLGTAGNALSAALPRVESRPAPGADAGPPGYAYAPPEVGPRPALIAATFAGTRLLCLAGLALGGHRAAGAGGLWSSLLAGAWHWDAHWYAGIVLHGYELARGTASNVAYFPAAPTLMGLVSHLVGHPIVAGMLLSIAESAIAVVLVVRVMEPIAGPLAARRGALLLLVWPTSVFLVLPYADALLLLAAAATFALGRRGHHLLGGLAGAVGALTRSTGALLVIPLALLIRDRKGRFDRHAVAAAIVLAGTAVYAIGLLARFGEPLSFASAESAGWNRLALPPPVTVAITVGRLLAAPFLIVKGRPDIPFTDFLDLAAIGLVAYALWTWRLRAPAAYLAWPAIGLLWPLVVGTISVSRYTLALFPAFALAAAPLDRRTWRRLVTISTVLLGVASFTFGAGGWIG
jgi:hypothetical protein